MLFGDCLWSQGLQGGKVEFTQKQSLKICNLAFDLRAFERINWFCKKVSAKFRQNFPNFPADFGQN